MLTCALPISNPVTHHFSLFTFHCSNLFRRNWELRAPRNGLNFRFALFQARQDRLVHLYFSILLHALLNCADVILVYLVLSRRKHRSSQLLSLLGKLSKVSLVSVRNSHHYPGIAYLHRTPGYLAVLQRVNGLVERRTCSCLSQCSTEFVIGFSCDFKSVFLSRGF